MITDDFNSPRSESDSGTVLCFGGSYKNRCHDREDAEQAIITGMPKFGMRDVCREKRWYQAGLGGDAYSHETTARRRHFDHIFTSNEFKIDDVQYEMRR